ncbi:thiomuracin/GE37468 family thiazolyl RiPP peptide [Streptomyces sp. NPDC048483]|uniref:thiomuracin/GE37468 family thiazolyl RiPP peptide n=1 Tax=Streptomyces sp. NPDC048483 TaxID=3154927 RepID=UPI00342BCDF2
MNKPDTVDYDFDDLPMDVFELTDSGITIESLTAGHGMTETGASSPCGSSVGTNCSGCSV